MNDRTEDVERVIESDTALVSLVSKAELDQSIATAHQWPRSITKFRREALEMATIDEQIASECIYALPRREWDDTAKKYVPKIITGPSARLAEIIVHAWGNVRAGARVIDEGKEFVTAQGVFHDLEKNVGITYEVKRRITGKEGKRFTPDMITVTANAACSIALRNAVFKGIPKALWIGVEAQVRKVIAGDAKTLGARREYVMKGLNTMGVPNEKIFAVLGVEGMSDVGLDEIVILQGLGNAIRENEMSIEEAFSTKEIQATSRTEGAKEALRARQGGAAPNPLQDTAQPQKAAQPQAAVAKPTPEVKPADADPDSIPWEAPPAKSVEQKPAVAEPKTDVEWGAALRDASKRSRADLDATWDSCLAWHDAAGREISIDLEAVYQLLAGK